MHLPIPGVLIRGCRCIHKDKEQMDKLLKLHNDMQYPSVRILTNSTALQIPTLFMM